MREEKLLSKYRGALTGLAVGDAVGTTVEFALPGTFDPVTDMVGGGPFQLKPGEWTDDTSMMLCLAASLISHGFDLDDQGKKYLRWYRHGYMSSNGACFDIGNTTLASLMHYEKYGTFRSSSIGDGNGSLMRLAPVPLFFADNISEAMDRSGESSRTTHPNKVCVDSCAYYGYLIASAVRGASKGDLLRPQQLVDFDLEVAAIAAGSYKDKKLSQLISSGHVVDTMEVALWAFHNTNSYRDGLLKVVNLGGDADTAGAVYGQLAGAYYGYENIPLKWREKIVRGWMINGMAKLLMRKSRKPAGTTLFAF